MQTTAHANDVNERCSISRSIRLDDDLESGTTGQGTLTRIPTQSHFIPATAMKNLRKLSVGTTCSERLPMTHHDPPSPKKHRNSVQIGAIECKSMQHPTITLSSFVNRRERLFSLRSQIPWNAYEHLRYANFIWALRMLRGRSCRQHPRRLRNERLSAELMRE
jgi:hypothetical protein